MRVQNSDVWVDPEPIGPVGVPQVMGFRVSLQENITDLGMHVNK